AQRTQRKWHISQTILGALTFLGALGGKAFYVSTEKDTLPIFQRVAKSCIFDVIYSFGSETDQFCST
ncbi:MAG: hypothetical protein OXG84_01420, partial [Chloroflexi bacterium]|nr:hypothetical protein [Chloroflexota bacterium]